MVENIYVLGAGSIGCLFAYYLKKYNNNVILIVRDNNNNNNNKNDNTNKNENNFEKPLSIEFKYKSSEGKSIDNDTINCTVKTPTQIEKNNEKIKVIVFVILK